MIGAFYGHISRIYISICIGHISPHHDQDELHEKWPYLQNYHSIKDFNTVHNLIILSLFLLFSQKNFGGGHFERNWILEVNKSYKPKIKTGISGVSFDYFEIIVIYIFTWREIHFPHLTFGLNSI